MDSMDWLEQVDREEDDWDDWAEIDEEAAYPEGFTELVEKLGFSSPEALFAEGVRLWEEELAGRNDDDYEFNREQGMRLLDAYEFFLEMTGKHEGGVKPLELKPREEIAYISAAFRIFDLTGPEIVRFCQAILYASAFGIDSLTDGRVCIELTFPAVFVRKEA